MAERGRPKAELVLSNDERVRRCSVGHVGRRAHRRWHFGVASCSSAPAVTPIATCRVDSG